MNEALLSEVFLKIINMSISASWLVLAVVLLRLVLKKAPKWISVLLWGFVAIRLICPFSIESVLSLIPSAETVSPEIMMDWTPEISTGIGSVDTVINPIITQTFAPDPATSANPLQILIPVAGMAWLAGIAIMLIYTAISYFLLRRKVATAVLLRKNIYQSENVDSPFVLGIIKPKVYLPFRMDGQNLEHVIAHEESHIQRKDHWWKPFGFVLLALHWFNPLMWLAYVLLCRDIELACDEKVIKEMDNENRANYTQALVACSVNRRSIAACPLAFGEVGVKERVKSVMNYKKPAFWVIVVAVITCIAVAVCFLTNPLNHVSLSKLKSDEINMPGILDDITGMIVTYEGISVACPEQADVNRFLATMEKIDISRDPISLNRSEDRDKDFTIMINANTELHFNKSFTEFWVDNHVKPSLTHRITNPETAKELLLDFNFTNSTVGGVDEPTNTTESWDLVPMIRVDGTLYLDTGLNSDIEGRCGVMDGEITSQVSGSERPTEDNQSNFGTGFGYQYGSIAGTIDLYMEGKWRIFATEQVRQQLQFSNQHTIVDDIDKLISNAILEKNAGDAFLNEPTGLIPVEAHYMLGITSVSGTPLAGQTNHMEEIIVYIQYAYHRYSYSNGKLERVAGAGSPAMLTFEKNEDGGYTLKEFWAPNEGSLYAEDIRKMFPEDIADMILNPESDVIDTEELEAKCLTKAQEHISNLAN